jgi:multiple sugar transport system permease protein
MKFRTFIGFTLPSIVMMLLIILMPVVLCVFLSFQYVDPAKMTSKFIGLDNYYTVLKESRFYNSMLNTFFYVGISVPIQIVLGFSIALLLNQSFIKFRGFFVGSSLLPHIMTPVVAALLLSWLFRERWGFYDYLLSQIGLNIHWYRDPWAARFLLIIYEIWKNTSFVTLVLFAGLKSLPDEPLEAARVDGASSTQTLWHIIIPLLSPLFVFVTLIRTMDAYREFANVFAMTGGGPGQATELITFYNYIVAFQHQDLGKGSAIGVLTVIGITILAGPFVWKVYREQLGK